MIQWVNGFDGASWPKPYWFWWGIMTELFVGLGEASWPKHGFG
jgi:hypothetical protein